MKGFYHRELREHRGGQRQVSQPFSVLPVNSVVRFPGPELGTFMVLHGLHVEILVRTSRCTRPAVRLSRPMNSRLASAPQSGELGRWALPQACQRPIRLVS